ncbi:hypothetical protein [Erysipelothrix aquatica]|uniref:hypothetical protein n=1 Tax=Erysipelothrix aquatica TaxID=2683714 RepID=UPI00135945B1|nr:hypothetical protein [Erysipelothrix aquatica]
MYKYNLAYSQIELNEDYKPNRKDVMALFLKKTARILISFSLLTILFTTRDYFWIQPREIVVLEFNPYKVFNTLSILLLTNSIVACVMAIIIDHLIGIKMTRLHVFEVFLVLIGAIFFAFWIPYLDLASILLMYSMILGKPCYVLLRDGWVVMKLIQRNWAFTDEEKEVIRLNNWLSNRMYPNLRLSKIVSEYRSEDGS